MHRKFKTPGNFFGPKRVDKKMNFSPKRLIFLKISDIKLSLISWESHKRLKVHFYHFHLSQNE